MVQLAYYQHKLKQGYNAKVKLRTLEPGDLVLKKIFGHGKKSSMGEIGAQLGRTLSYHLVGWHKSIFSRRFK